LDAISGALPADIDRSPRAATHVMIFPSQSLASINEDVKVVPPHSSNGADSHWNAVVAENGV
jgi:hypothetical protein